MSVQTESDKYAVPSDESLQHAVKIAIVKDKPIMVDYWLASLEKTVLIGIKEDKEKLLVKSADEYTSPISKIYKVGAEYIIETDNSLYIVSNAITSKRIA